MFFFDLAFLVSCSQLIFGVIGMLVQGEEGKLKTVMKILFKLSNSLMITLWIYAFLVRYMHSGSECCGDYTVSKDKAKSLLYIQGMFIKFTSLFICFMLLLVVVGMCLNYYQRLTGGI